jgi:death-on-curing protein
MVDFLSLDDLLDIAHGVLPEVAVRDAGLLVSAAERPRTTVFGEDAYADLETKAAALFHSLTRNRPLVHGNERLAWSATRIFCLLNDADLDCTVDEAEGMALAAAAGHIDVTEITAWVRARRSS